MASITEQDIINLQQSMECVLSKISEFSLLNSKLLPEGLKPIARSISLIVEQVVVQNLRVFSKDCGIEFVIDPPGNLTPYDCIIKLKNNSNQYHVNLKTSLVSTTPSGKFDISKATGLIQFYNENPDAKLLVGIVKVELDNLTVKFKNLVLFNVAWTPDMYYNRANHNLQSKCDGTFSKRTNKEFVLELEKLVTDAGHSTHY